MNGNWLEADRYAVWGLGRSGQAAANLLARRGKRVVASDLRSSDEMADRLGKLHQAVETTFGENIIGDAQVIVLSPGLAPGLEIIAEAGRREIPVISEVEVAFAAAVAPWLAITGTDGKTTTTSLVGSMLDRAGVEYVVGGNIGAALCDLVESVSAEGVVVAELSANQLWACHNVDASGAAITNLAPDHLDYFASMADYAAAKRRIFEMQSPEGVAVLPGGDPSLSRSISEGYPGEVIHFGFGAESVRERARGVYFDAQGRGWWRDGEREEVWIEDSSEIRLVGRHNQLNAACAAALVSTMGVSIDAMREGLLSFEPLTHRMQPVARIGEVRFINDSKATNPHASLAGLRGLAAPMIVIAGGYDKGLDMTQWSDFVAGAAEEIVLIGANAEKLGAELEGKGAGVRRSPTLASAVEQAYRLARPGTTVILSPATSSYDMFSTFEERGEEFRRAVMALKTRGSRPRRS